jgi:hypothetical protein
MGKKSRKKRESRGAKDIIETIMECDKVIAETDAKIANLIGQKSQVLAGMLIEGQNILDFLHSILNNSQVQAVVDIVNRQSLDDIARTKLLKQYLAQFKMQLEAKGLLPDYFAYLIMANEGAVKQMSAQSSQPEPTSTDVFGPDSRN